MIQDEERILESVRDFTRFSDLSTVGKSLQQASKLNPGSLRADFLLGMANALRVRSAQDAEAAFQECVRRLLDYEADLSDADRANLAACYNNLALTCIRQRKIGDALKHWEKCLALEPGSYAVLHNLARLQQFTHQDSIFRLTKPEADRLDRLCASVPGMRNAFDETRGWRYALLVASDPRRHAGGVGTSPPSTPGSAGANLMEFGFGTGVVVGKGLVVTNRHVIDDGLIFKVRRHGESKQEARAASIVASSSDPKLDLALLRCEKLDSPYATFNENPPALTTEVRTVGFARTAILETQLRETSGTIVGLPPLPGVADPNSRMCLMHDAMINHGCSGGPLYDRFGAVVGVNTSGMFQFSYYLAVPAKSAIEFLRPHVPDLQVKRPAEGDAKSWEGAVAQVRASTVQVLVLSTPDRFNPIIGSVPLVEADSYEDRWCMACFGWKQVQCPNRGCANGGVRSWREDSVVFPNGDVHLRCTPIRVRCDSCGGDGLVSCTRCNDGVDPRYPK